MYKFKTQPFAHQADAMRAAWGKPAFAFFMEMGTGKTKVDIDESACLFLEGRIDGWLIIAPKGVYGNWAANEIPTHMPDEIKRKVVLWRASPRKAEVVDILAIVQPPDPAILDIFIMNVDALATKKGQEAARTFLKNHIAKMSIDESTTIKSHGSIRGEAAADLGRLAKFRRILCGSPTPNGPLDIYQQAAFLDGWVSAAARKPKPAPYNLLGFPNFWAFRARHAVMRPVPGKPPGVNFVVGYKNVPELAEKIKTWSFRVLKKDCLDLPAKLYTTREVELTDEQRKHYENMRDHALTEIRDQDIKASSVLVWLLRLHQIVCGHLSTPDGQVVSIKNNRLAALMEVIEDVNPKAKVIIWATYRHDIKSICAELVGRYGDTSTVSYFGDTSDDDRTAAIQGFQSGKADSPRFFVGNPQTGGLGITLTASSTTIYYSNNYDLEKRLQSEDRNHRIGQHWPVTYIDLITPKTVDERIVKALRKKINLAATITGDEFKEWLA